MAPKKTKAIVVAGESIPQAGGLVAATHGKVFTTSLVVADRFGKAHKNVLRDIERYLGNNEIEAFTGLNFEPSDYVDSTGRTLKMYTMTQKGFAFLVSGFTGDKALVWRTKFVDAFAAMADELARIELQKKNLDWQEARLTGKEVRHEWTDTVKRFADYALEQGSKGTAWLYKNLTETEYTQLFTFEGKCPPRQALRDKLTVRQLEYLSTAETMVVDIIEGGMNEGLHYKDIYAKAKQKLATLADLIGKALPGEDQKILDSTKQMAQQNQPPTMREIEAIFAALCDLADIQKATIDLLPPESASKH